MRWQRLENEFNNEILRKQRKVLLICVVVSSWTSELNFGPTFAYSVVLPRWKWLLKHHQAIHQQIKFIYIFFFSLFLCWVEKHGKIQPIMKASHRKLMKIFVKSHFHFCAALLYSISFSIFYADVTTSVDFPSIRTRFEYVLLCCRSENFSS